MTKEEKLKQIYSAVEYYKNSTETIKSVSSKFNIRNGTLSKYLKLNKIEIRKNPINSSKSNKLDTISDDLKEKRNGLSKSQFKQLLINLAIEEYITTSVYDRSITKLSDKYGINRKTIIKYLKERNIEITQSYNKVPFNETVFDSIDTEEKAYWLGFMYADGYITSKSFRIGLSLAIKDIEHLRKFNAFLQYSKGMNVTNSHQFGSKEKYNKSGELMQTVSTVITNKHLWEALNSKGCVPNKSLILKFPDESIFKDKSLIRHFIRGYFDGDGSLGLYQHSKTNPKLEESLIFVGTQQFLYKVQEYLGVRGFIMQKSNCGPNTFKLGYSTKKANKVAEILYKNAFIYLDRKYNIYITKFAANKSEKNGEG